ADTHTPSFYRGRAEPVSGQPIRLIAIPSADIAVSELTYSWKIDGRTLPESGPVVTVFGPLSSSFTVHVTASNQSRPVAQKSEVISLSNPELLIYEMNALRGRSAVAVSDEYSLIGSEAEFLAVPYFTDMNIVPLQGMWRVNGRTVKSGNDWHSLVLNRPETPDPRYTIELEVTSPSGYMGKVSKSFHVNMGL